MSPAAGCWLAGCTVQAADGCNHRQCIACSASSLCLQLTYGMLLPAGGYDMSVWYCKDPSSAAKGYTDWPLEKPQQA